MSGAYLGDLNQIYPGLHQILGGKETLRGGVDHIVQKARTLSRERGRHRLSDEQLLVMMAYWEGLELAREQKGHEIGSWYGDRAAPYMHELFERGVDNQNHPHYELFAATTALLYMKPKQ